MGKWLVGFIHNLVLDAARHGLLPPQCAAINRTNINVQELAVLGATTGDRDAVHQAIAMDPLTGVLLTLPQIRMMVSEMFKAEEKFASYNQSTISWRRLQILSPQFFNRATSTSDLSQASFSRCWGINREAHKLSLPHTLVAKHRVERFKIAI